MAILLARGWDRGNTMMNTVDISMANATLESSTANPKTGTHSLRLSSGSALSTNRWARWAVPGQPSNPSVSAWLYPMSSKFNTDDAWAVAFGLTTGEFIQLRWNGATHTFDAYVNNIFAAAGTVEVSFLDYFHLQFYVVIDNGPPPAGAGHIGVLIDGHESIDWAGDTQPGAAAGADYFYWQSRTAGGTWGTAYMDDLVIGDGGFLGSLRCRERVPNADTLLIDWTPNAGANHFDRINETPASAATYNESDATGQVDQIELTTIDFAALQEYPVALSPWVRAYMHEGTGDSIIVGLDSAGVPDNTTHALGTQEGEYYWHMAEEDPDGGGQAWDTASANAADLVYESLIT